MPVYTKATKVVTADVPDPDNFLMILRVLKDNPKQKVEVVLSPRPVSFKAAPYGRKFGHLCKAIGATGEKQPVRCMVSWLHRDPATMAWIKKLPVRDQSWFYADPGFDNATVEADTRLYMAVSALRLIAFLDAHEICRDQYTVYWDAGSLRKIDCGMRYAAHKPDFTFDLDNLDTLRYKKLIDENVVDDEGNVKNVWSDILRDGTREILRGYVTKKCKSLGLGQNAPLHSIEELFKAHSADDALKVYVGGPFTEALTILHRLPKTRTVVGMGGFVTGLSNIFYNQFNFMVDMKSAKAVIEMAQQNKIALKLLPTEAVKESPYSLDAAGLKEAFGAWSPSTMDLYRKYETSSDPRYNIFDMIAAMIVTVPELYSVKKVAPIFSEDNPSGGSAAANSTVTRITFKPSAQGSIEMCWPDLEYMKKHRTLLIHEMQKTVGARYVQSQFHL